MTTLFLSTLLGWFIILFSLLMIFHQEHMNLVMLDVLKHPGLFFILALITTLLGLIMVLNHNIWVWGWPLVVTVFSWMVLIGGLIRLFFYDYASKLGSYFFNNPKRMRITGIIMFFIGLGLLSPIL
ncbi:MAG: hypothetical protein H0U75_03605 [Legionella sp.]|nr:hypothetical protein [Legionella sp.]